MKFHIVLHRKTDLITQDELAKQGQSPHHVMNQLAHRLNAIIHAPDENLSIRGQDRLWSKILGSPENWALARDLVSKTSSEDVIFCNSEVVGLPIAALCRKKPNAPQLAVFVHNLDRPRGRAALCLTQAASSVNQFMACSQYQIEFLRRYLNLSTDRTTFIWDQTDLSFFSPGSPSAQKSRPLIVGVGLEQRDYRTLAAATANLPVDVKISGFSQDAKTLKQAFPEVMPENMSRQFYEWADLLQLYRDADIVVVSTFPNRYAAGVQVMMEAMACGRPTIVTETEGLMAYLTGHDAVIRVPSGQAISMREAITRLLEHPAEAAQLSQRALSLAQERYNSAHYVEAIAHSLESLPHLSDARPESVVGVS